MVSVYRIKAELKGNGRDRINIVSAFKNNFRGILSAGAMVKINELDYAGQTKLKSLALTLWASIKSPWRFKAGQELSLDDLNFGISIGRLKTIMVVAASLDRARNTILEPVLIDGKLKLITLEEKRSFCDSPFDFEINEKHPLGLLSMNSPVPVPAGAPYREIPTTALIYQPHNSIVKNVSEYSKEKRISLFGHFFTAISSFFFLAGAFLTHVSSLGMDCPAFAFSLLMFVSGAASTVLSLNAGLDKKERQEWLMRIISAINELDPSSAHELLVENADMRVVFKKERLGLLESGGPEKNLLPTGSKE